MTHFEYMEQQGQLTIFDMMNSSLFRKGDQVDITLADSDDLTFSYFKYYYPHVINKPGVIVEVKRLKNGCMVYLVNILGELHWMYESDIS